MDTPTHWSLPGHRVTVPPIRRSILHKFTVNSITVGRLLKYVASYDRVTTDSIQTGTASVLWNLGFQWVIPKQKQWRRRGTAEPVGGDGYGLPSPQDPLPLGDYSWCDMAGVTRCRQNRRNIAQCIDRTKQQHCLYGRGSRWFIFTCDRFTRPSDSFGALVTQLKRFSTQSARTAVFFA